MHIGNNTGICPELQVHGTVMQNIYHDKYLGDIVSLDGSNDQNISSRVAKGLGIVTQLMNMLEKVTLGKHYFKIAMLFRESIFLNGILTNASSWHGLSPTHISQLESVDKLLIRQILNTPMSTPVEVLFLELGIVSIGTIIKAARVNYLHYLALGVSFPPLYHKFVVHPSYLVTYSIRSIRKVFFLLKYFFPCPPKGGIASKLVSQEA